MTREPGALTLSEDDRRVLAVWAADCAARTLALFEDRVPGDPRPRAAVDGARAFARGDLRVGPARDLAAQAHAAARAAGEPVATAAARAAGHAAAVAHMAGHVLGAPAYAARAVTLARPDNPAAAAELVDWAAEHATPGVRAALRRLPRRTDAPGPLGAVMLDLQDRLTAGEPLEGRPPTSHERMTGRPWDASYHNGPAPWDIGEPQPAIVRLADGGAFTGPVLDAGCGTGDNALHLAARGLPVLGVDVAGTAVTIARQKAHDRGIKAEFEIADAFQLHRLGRRFRTVLDCGLFHTFDTTERPRYVAGLTAVTEPGGTLYVLCFSDEGPDTGPHPVAADDLRAAFHPGAGWAIVTLAPDRVHTRFHDERGAPAWLATIERTSQPAPPR
jgi:SAM-dependent methyltransferase